MTTTPDTKRGHALTITKSDDWHPDQPDFDAKIDCLDPPSCGGWQECLEPHQVDGKSAADGPWDSELEDPWCDEDEFEFHGVAHTWHYGYGWTVPFPGCVVAANDSVYEQAHDIGLEHGPGRYLVNDDWEDESCYLTVLATVEAAS